MDRDLQLELAAAAAKAAKAKAQRAASASDQPDEGGSFENTMGFVNRGLVDTAFSLFDLPTYPIRKGYNLLTGDTMESPSNTISGILRNLGVSVAEQGEAADTTVERVAEFIGGTAGGLGLLGAGRNALTAGGGAVADAASTLTAPYMQTPVRAVAQDMTAATGAAIAGKAAEELPAADPDAAGAGGSRVGGAMDALLQALVPGAGLASAAQQYEGGDTGQTPIQQLGDAAGRAAQDLPPDLLRTIGELGGGVVGAAAGPAARETVSGAATVAGQFPVAGAAIKVGEQFANPMRAQRRRAETATQGLVEESPSTVIQNVEQESVLPLTAMQRSGEPRLMKAEQDILKRPGNAPLDLKYKRQRDRIFQTAEGEILGMAEGGSPQQASELIGQWVSTTKGRLETARDEAVERAVESVRRAGSPDADQATLSTRFTEELNKTYNAVKDEEKSLWGQLPGTVTGATTNSRAALADIVDNRPVLEEFLPERVKGLLDPESPRFLGEETSAVNLKDMYSVLRGIQRSQSAVGGDQTVANLANKLARGVDEDIENIADVSPAFNAARAYSRNLHKVFDEGDVAAVLGTARDGSSKVRPEVALSRLMGGSGPRLVGQANILDDILGPQTITNRPGPEALTTANTFIARRYQDAALPDPMLGDASATGAQRFVNTNKELLNSYPALGDKLRRSAVEVQAEGKKIKSVEEELTALASTPEARFSDARTFAEFDEILRSKRPAADMAQLRRTAQEIGPEAEAGLQASATQYILSKMQTYRDNQRGLTSSEVLDPSKRGVNDPNVAAMLEEMFDPDQLQNMNRVLDELSRVDASTAARRGGTAAMQTDAGEDSVLKLIAQTGGLSLAKYFTPPGLGTIQGPAKGSALADYLRKVLTADAAQDMVERAILQKTPEDAQLFKTLLSPTGTPDLRNQAKSVLESWLRTNGYTQGLDAEDPVEAFRESLGLPQVNLPDPYTDNPFMPR